MTDLIDRQAAINEMKIRRHSAYEWYVTAKSKDDEEIMIRADSALASFIECILTIKKLPSAQPQSTMGQVNDTAQSTNDYISRQAAINEIDEWIKAFRENGHKESAADACLIQDGIIQLPSVDAVEVRHGRWVHDGLDIPHGVDWMHCSECGRRDKYCPAAMTNYCPSCGARMDGKQNED